MKYLYLSAVLFVAACAPALAGGLEVAGQAGASIPSGNSHTGVSPTVQASVIQAVGKYLGFGIRVGDDINYVEKDRPQSDGSRGNGVSGLYLSPKPPKVDVDVNQDQTQIQDQSQTNTQIVNILPPVQGTPPKTLRDLAPSSIFSIEPLLRLGLPLGDWLPYIVGTYGVSRVDRQDGVKDWGNAYSWGGGIRYDFGGYFAGLEAQKQQVCTSVSTYDTNKFLASAGIKF